MPNIQQRVVARFLTACAPTVKTAWDTIRYNIFGSKQEVKVTARQVTKACKASAAFLKEHRDVDIAALDFRKIEWEMIKDYTTGGLQGQWRVYPKGEYGNKDGPYAYGYVRTRIMAAGGAGVEVTAWLEVAA